MPPWLSITLGVVSVLGTIITIGLFIRSIGEFRGIIQERQKVFEASLSSIQDTNKEHDKRLRDLEISMREVMMKLTIQLESVTNEMIRMRDAVHSDRQELQNRLLEALIRKSEDRQINKESDHGR